MQNKNKLPHNTQLVMLKGSNHSQFGYLGTLFMDNGATISIEEQQQATLVQLLLVLQKVQSTNNQHP